MDNQLFDTDGMVQNDNISSYNIGEGDLLTIFQDDEVKDAKVYRHGTFIKHANLLDDVEKRIFIVEIIELGAIQSRLALALNISRQTIHNYIETKRIFGMEGLIRNYRQTESKNLLKQRMLHSKELLQGDKAKQLAEARKKEREEIENKNMNLNFSFTEVGKEKLESSEEPFCDEHGWIESRYAGIFSYIISLTSNWDFFKLVINFFGKEYFIFMVFILMVARNIRSIEQLKNIRLVEAGVILGIKKLPSRTKVWKWFYDAANKKLSTLLLICYFRHQIQKGLVNTWAWFTDGHLLPYTGQEKVHHSYNTQRRMPMPGRTNIVTCDSTGRIVDFEIQEGKGDMKNHIVKLAKKWKNELSEMPVYVFDREGYGSKFFSALVKEKIPFVTWDKYLDTKELEKIEDERFKEHFIFNDKNYSIFEENKSFTYPPEKSESDSEEQHTFELRHIYIWNKTSNRRTCGLAFRGEKQMSTLDCTQAILTRWGASENTFKHCANRHPLHYHPGFKLTKSKKQEIANPEIKGKKELIKQIKNELNKLYKKLAERKEYLNRDGKPRKNSSKETVKKEIEQEKSILDKLIVEKNKLPEKINVSNLENYRSFKCIDNEGKNLFDFVTSAVWNARKQMVDMLRPLYNNENDLIDLFYAITKCHGWIKSTKTEVIVRLEPLQQSKRRLAQEQLCRKLSSSEAQTPNGKWLRLEVGTSPL